MNGWFQIANVADVLSPALLLYPDRARENVRRMIRMAGGADRLRPHIKTHKMAELTRMQLDEGISKFKCATIAEAEMAAAAGAKDVLIAFPIVGPNQTRLLELTRKFPAAKFSCLADNPEAVVSLARIFSGASGKIEVLLDIDCGQHRTGIEPGPKAIELYVLIGSSPGVVPGGIHAYDGHISEPEIAKRTALCEAAFAPVKALCDELRRLGQPVPRVVAGGAPSFPIHARNPLVECSPGTCVLWDFGYADKFADMDFLFAALVLTRVISKPGANRLCLDLGHKAIAAENPPPRVRFLNLPDAVAVSHSEEHLVVESSQAESFTVGDCLYGAPQHVCPTVALYSEATVVRDSRASECWRVTARERRLTL